jgi:hypothetical protein
MPTSRICIIENFQINNAAAPAKAGRYDFIDCFRRNKYPPKVERKLNPIM